MRLIKILVTAYIIAICYMAYMWADTDQSVRDQNAILLLVILPIIGAIMAVHMRFNTNEKDIHKPL